MMYIVWLVNLAIIGIAIGLAYTIHINGTGFALGVLFALGIYQIVHYLHYGHWF